MPTKAATPNPDAPASADAMATTCCRLAVLLEERRDALLSTWRRQVRELPSARDLDVPTLDDHLPGLLVELATAMRAHSDQTIPQALNTGSSPAHGLQRVKDAFDIAEVVAEYNILRGCISDLADDDALNLQGRPLHIINRVFDQAIGTALQAYSTQRALEVQGKREEYLAFVAHDLRTPLNAISLAGRVLELTLPPGATGDGARMLKALRRNVKHLELLVGKILEENSNLQTELGLKLERRMLDLWPLVEGLIHDLHPVGGTRSIRLVNAVEDDFTVWADANLLRRVLQNLIANAIRHTPRGEVVIGARLLEGGAGVECFVRDDGTGIPAALLGKVFDKGETSDPADGGLGLGLAIVKTFVEAHGGSVAVDSREGAGSTFRFSLPGNEAARS